MNKGLLKNSRRLDIFIMLAAIAVSVVVRLLTRQADVPIIINDEAVYPNLAKSILATGELRFFGMSISYLYIAYPLLLIPVYLLPAAVNKYLVIGIIGTLLMSSAAIPAYMLGKKITGERSGAWCAAAVLLLMPDMSFGARSMNECLCYLLFFWTLWFAYKAICEKKYAMYIVVALLSLVAFYTKPGYVAIGGTALVLGVVFGLRDKDKKAWLFSAGAAALLGALIIAVRFAIIAVFKVNTDASAYYTAGISDITFSWGLVLAMLKYFFSYITYFILACGVVGAIVPVFALFKLNTNQRRIMIILLVSALATVIGALITVHIDQYLNNGTTEVTLNRIHLRYLAAYVPLMFSFLFCPSLHAKSESKSKKKPAAGLIGSKWFVPAIILSALFLIFRVNGVSLSGCYFDAYILIVLSTLCNTLQGQLFVAAVTCVGIVALLYHISKNRLTAKFCRVSAIIFACVLVLESTLAFVETKKDLGYMEDDAIELSVHTDGTDCVYLDDFNKTYMVDHYAFDVQSRDTVYYTQMQELISQCDTRDGAYMPFIVETIGEHVSYDAPLPEDTYLVFSEDEASLADFNDALPVFTTQNSTYTAVKTEAGERLFDSVFVSATPGVIAKDESAYITVYNPELLGRTLTLRLNVESEGSGDTLTVSSGGSTQTLSVSSGEHWAECTVTIPDGYKWIDISASSGNVDVHGFELK